MPLPSKKRYARFNVGKFMLARKATRDNMTATHQSIENAKRLLDAEQLKLKRLQAKVCI